MASLKDISFNVHFKDASKDIFELLTGTSLPVEQIVSLVAAAAPLPQGLGSPQAIRLNIAAALHQDDDAHDTCSLTACLNPLHPGPCKGWKGTLFDAAPGAWHALEAAKVEKANTARIKKIVALKEKGLPIPHKLLAPIVAKAHPHAGKTANKASGEAHEAGKAITESSGIHVNEPGKVSLGKAVKSAPVTLGPKGKKQTLASKGIAHVIGQEKVTPQYKLDKAAAITPQQWADLSDEDKASIRGELAKIKIDGFGPQQKKADELLTKLPMHEPLKPGAPNTVTTPSGQVHQKITLKETSGGPKATTAPPPKKPEGDLHTPKNPDQPISTTNFTPAMLHAVQMAGTQGQKKSLQERLDAYNKLTPEEWSEMPPGSQDTILKHKAEAAKLGKAAAPGKIETVTTPSGKVVQKINLPPEKTPTAPLASDEAVGNLSDTLKKAPEPTAPSPKATGPLSQAQQQTLETIKSGRKVTNYAGQPGVNLNSLNPLIKKGLIHYDKDAGHFKPGPPSPIPEAKPKPLPKHVEAAIAMANGQAPGATWSKNHLAAYQPLTAEEFHALPKDVQGKIVDELTKAQSKFLDPKKVAAAKDLLTKFGKGEGPKVAAPKVAAEDVDFAKHLHDHSITAVQAKAAVEKTGLPAHFAAAKHSAGLTDADNPNLGLHSLNADKDAKALVAQKTKLYDKTVLNQPDVKDAASNLEKAAYYQAHAQAVQDAKSKAFNRISLKLGGASHGDLSPIEKASLLHLQKHLLEHNTPPTKAADIDKLKADTKQAENELAEKLHAAVKKANAPKPQNMTPGMIENRVEELIGNDATNPDVASTVTELQFFKKQGQAAADTAAEKYAPEVMADPSVLAKHAALSSLTSQLGMAKSEQSKLASHLKFVHQDYLKLGKDQFGNPLTADDEKVIELHAEQLKAGIGQHLDNTVAVKTYKLAEAQKAFDDAATKAQAALKPPEPVKLSDFDQATIGDAYANAWGKHATGAVNYGVKTYDQQQKMQAHADYPQLKQNLGDLKALSRKLALAHAEERTAQLNVPVDPDSGQMVMGTPEAKAWAAALGHTTDVQNEFDALHKTTQARLDTIRTSVGLKKRALPKVDSAAVKSAAAETGHHKSSGYGAPNYGKPAAAKQYMLAKVGPKLAVAHMTKADKGVTALKKSLGDVGAPSSPKKAPAPVGEPVKLGGGDSSIAHVPDALKKTITGDFKGMPKGKYLADPTEDIFDNLVNLAAGHGKAVPGGLSVDQVLKTIDETHSKSLGVANSGMLHKKVTDWLGTAAGKTYAEQHSTPDPKVIKQITGEIDLPKGVTLAPGEKVQKLAGPGAHDDSLGAKAFHPHTSAEAEAEQAAYMKANGIKWTAGQKKAMTAYTGNGSAAYNGINNYLRGDGGYDQVVKQFAVDIQSAMMPLREDTLLKRGTGWPPELASFQSNPEALLGHTFEDKGFVSTSVAGSGGHFSGKPLQLVIEAPKGSPAVFVNGISHYKGQENEMLLAAGTKFKVLSVDKTSGGHTLMRVRIVGDK